MRAAIVVAVLCCALMFVSACSKPRCGGTWDTSDADIHRHPPSEEYLYGDDGEHCHHGGNTPHTHESTVRNLN